MEGKRCNSCGRNLPITAFRLRKRTNDRGYYYETREQPCRHCKSYETVLRSQEPEIRLRNLWNRRRKKQIPLNKKRKLPKRKGEPTNYKKHGLFLICPGCDKLLARSDYYVVLGGLSVYCKECTKERQRAYRLRMRIEHPEIHARGMAKLKKWKEENKHRIATRRRHYRLVDGNDLTDDEWRWKLILWGNKCAYCESEEEIERDHVIAHSRGGLLTENNIVPACRSCNQDKSNKDIVEWMVESGRLQPPNERETYLSFPAMWAYWVVSTEYGLYLDLYDKAVEALAERNAVV